LEKAGEADTVRARVTVPADVRPGAYSVRYGVRCSGRLYDVSLAAVMETAPGLGGEPDPATCIREKFITRPAVVTVDLIDVKVHEGHRYAYLGGTGDTVPRMLGDLGLSVHMLDDEELAYAALDAYDTIVVGPNAYVVRDGVRKAAQRLLDYVYASGTLVVQYQAYAFEKLGATPFP